MHLTTDELKKIYFGAYEFAETEDGFLQAFQYSLPQREYFRGVEPYWYDRCMASTAKTIEMITAATEFSFDYKIIWQGSLDSMELFADGECMQVHYIKDLPAEGRISFRISEGKNRRITIYLPIDATIVIRDFALNAPYELLPERKKVLWMGDSITQGFGPLRSSMTYVSVSNRILDYDIINQGIGGYIYDAGSVMKMGDYTPDEIIVALGTNQYDTRSMRPVEEFYERLFEIYGNSIPTTVITPVWRGDLFSSGQKKRFADFCAGLREICERYSNITIVDGLEMIPNSSVYYVDGLHPNEKGAKIYGENFAKMTQGDGDIVSKID